MFREEEYDSDTSDEDFVPEGVESEDEPESDEQDEDIEQDDNEEGKMGRKAKKKKTGKKKKKNPLLADLEEGDVQSEKREEESAINEEKNKAKEEDIWADFLADVDDKPDPPPKPKSSSWASLLGNKKTTNTSSPSSAKAAVVAPIKEVKKDTSSSSTVKITKIFEFAGEEVRVEKEVDANSEEAKLALASPTKSDSHEGAKGTKRPGGLSSIMGLLDGKKQKLTTLEKTKLDWNSFKVEEGIDEELESHKKSKHGYLDKKAFLERADVRQFEIERAMRMNKKSNR